MVSLIQNYLYRYHKNVWVLFLAQSIGLSCASMLVLVGTLLGAKIAPDVSMSTLPMAFFVLGTALCTFPAALFMKRYGRKLGFFLGAFIAISHAFVIAYAAYREHFYLLLWGTAGLGVSLSFVQQYRFAVIETTSSDAQAGEALALLLFSGIIAAFAGPELAVFGQNVFSHLPSFTGSFIALAIYLSLSIFVLFFYHERQALNGEDDQKPNYSPISHVLTSKNYLAALAAMAVGYGLMSLIMTSTPISMHKIDGYDLVEAKQVIQAHIMAMFLPGFFTSWLIKRLGVSSVMILGCFAMILVLAFGVLGQELVHYWFALVLLGISWNFLFLSGTVMLGKSYGATDDKFKLQAINDFSVFFIQAIAALSAGWIILQFGWKSLMLISFPIILATMFFFIIAFIFNKSPLK